MATLAADSPMTKVTGELGSVPIIANDIVYEGAMVGENAAGYGRPLVAGDRFLGHAISRCDNTVTGPNQKPGAAGDMNITLLKSRYRLVVALAGYVTDVEQPVYASDDATYTFVGANASGPNSFVGIAKRYVSSTKMEVEFMVGETDEFGNNPNRVLKTDDYTTLLADGGKIIYLGTDTKVITLCIGTTTLGAYELTIVNCAGDGLALIEVDPNAADLINGGCGLGPGADGKKFSNTKATARRGDFLQLTFNSSTGWNVKNRRGIWAIES
jgi:hypothetical protein